MHVRLFYLRINTQSSNPLRFKSEPVKEAVQSTVYIEQSYDDVFCKIAPHETRHFNLHDCRNIPVGKEGHAADEKAQHQISKHPK